MSSTATSTSGSLTRRLRLAAGIAVVLTVLVGLVAVGYLVLHDPAPILRTGRPPEPGLVVADPTRAASASVSRSESRAGPGPDGVADAAPAGHWVTSVATAAGIPAPAVAAYGRATLRLDAEQPGCHLGWTTLAGIGEVESGHGTIGGRALDSTGRPSSAIIGPALDGVGDVAAIAASPGSTAVHGDPRWDHAVGPLQFLPSTWAQWGADGDGDGAADPHDLDDAALAAGRYLCASGDLASDTGWYAGVFSYNHADAYVRLVNAYAAAYAAATA